MNKKIFAAVVLVAATLTGLKAQNQPQTVKLDAAPETVAKVFASKAPAATNVQWSQTETDRDVFIMARYLDMNDTREMIFRNNAYYATKTTVPVQYCPKSIQTGLDTLAPGFQLSELYYESSNSQKGYLAIVTKTSGKKKQQITEVRDFLFSIKGELLKESDPNSAVRGF